MTTYQYQGKGQFFPGIPARDLTERDVARLSGEQVATLEGSGLYVKAQRLDPLGELTDEQYEQLSPAEKGARTRKANEQHREAEASASQGDDASSEGEGDGGGDGAPTE